MCWAFQDHEMVIHYHVTNHSKCSGLNNCLFLMSICWLLGAALCWCLTIFSPEENKSN